MNKNFQTVLKNLNEPKSAVQDTTADYDKKPYSH